ncbi:MAG: ATP-binding protein [Microscillaceae bacterium]|nr:ATP-binding protein [Microscillaceae bacterium]MDW8461203.1 ATP-binding protein [Cytophagales bacterium]
MNTEEKTATIDTNYILKSIEKVATAFKDSELTEKNKRKILANLSEEIKCLGNFLHCNEEETWIFCVIFALSISGRDTDLESLSVYLRCNPFFIFTLTPSLDSLVAKRLLIKNSSYDMRITGTRFLVSNFVFSAISNNKPLPESNNFSDVYELIERVNEMIFDRERNNIPTADLFNEVENLLEKEKHFPLIKKIRSLNLNTDYTLLLLYLCASYANETNEADLERFIYSVYDSMGAKIRAKKLFYAESSPLVERNLVSFNDNSFYGGKEIMLTDKAIELLFGDEEGTIDRSKTFNPKNCFLLKPDKIRTTPLFFNEEEKKYIELIEKLLEEPNYQKAIQKFKAHNLHSGVTILLYGDPGTGKTQVVYNLVHKTGRIGLMVDISSIRDKYVGESEKRIKQVFRTYRQAREIYDLCPILFFNESDALISKRYEINSSIDQMNNSMQNIILQELEDFEGILIATSNLSMNLDSAFERRFLYKIRFQKPDSEVRKQIWQAKMPELSAEDVAILADSYILTGGQIDNISKKYLLEHILNDEPPDLNDLKELCEMEYFGREKGRVGFLGR